MEATPVKGKIIAEMSLIWRRGYESLAIRLEVSQRSPPIAWISA